jgi:hypothetical protein
MTDSKMGLDSDDDRKKSHKDRINKVVSSKNQSYNAAQSQWYKDLN